MIRQEETYHFEKIAEAITFIDSNFKKQPSLDLIAEHLNLSPFHFQRLFKEWVGISPKKYLQFVSSNYAKALLQKSEFSLFNTAYETGLSGSGRLHDLFVNIEGMTPGEYKNGGANLSINYSYAESTFGKMIVASTNKGICHLSFINDTQKGFAELNNKFPNASYNQCLDEKHKDVLPIFTKDWSNLKEIKLHLKGTNFQLKVWETLLSIPEGRLSSYGAVAKKINRPKASRAVGTAIGNNPIAFLIPCHRVIKQSGNIGEYRWGGVRKKAIIGWEAARLKVNL